MEERSWRRFAARRSRSRLGRRRHAEVPRTSYLADPYWALAEFRVANPGLDDAGAPGGAGAEFFRCHDTAHVVFGCSISLVVEALADAWTLFGTTVTGGQFLGFLKIRSTKVLSPGSAVGLYLPPSSGRCRSLFWLPARPSHDLEVALVAFDSYLDRSLVEIRRQWCRRASGIPKRPSWPG